MDFDPNAKRGPKTPEWATYVPDRNPDFKVHKRKADALNAFPYRDNYILYRYDFDTGKWVEQFRIENRPTPEICDRCHRSTLRESVYASGTVRNTGMWRWVPKSDPPRQWFVHQYRPDCYAQR